MSAKTVQFPLFIIKLQQPLFLLPKKLIISHEDVQCCNYLEILTNSGDFFNLLSAEIVIEWNVSEACSECHRKGGQCFTDNGNEFYCKRERNRLTLILSIALPIGGVLLLLSLLFTYIIWQRKKKSGGAYLLSRSLSSDPSPKSDIEGGSFYFGVPIFSYTELEEATNNFDPSKELGHGGFGTVYYGKKLMLNRMYIHWDNLLIISRDI